MRGDEIMKFSSTRVSVNCSNGARFASRLIQADINVFDVIISNDNVSLKVDDSQLSALISIAEELGYQVQILEQYGANGFLKKCLISLPYAVTIMVTVVLGFVSSMYVFDIRVETANGVPNYEVRRVLEENNIVGVMPKSKIDGRLIEQLLLDSIPEINFATVYVDGISLCVSLVQSDTTEGTVKQKTLISTADGIVSRVMVRSGTAVVEAGMSVKAGDELIAGYHICDNTPTDDIEEGEKIECEADGEVYGTVYHHKRIVIPKNIMYMQATGAKKSIRELYLGNWRIGKVHKVPYETYQLTRTEQLTNNLLPIKYVNYTYYEYERIAMDKSTYIDRIFGDIIRDISANMPAGGRILSSHHELKSTAMGEVLDVHCEVEQRLDNGGYDY